VTSVPKYQKFPSRVTLFGTSLKRCPLVSGHDHFGVTLLCFLLVKEMEISQWEEPDLILEIELLHEKSIGTWQLPYSKKEKF